MGSGSAFSGCGCHEYARRLILFRRLTSYPTGIKNGCCVAPQESFLFIMSKRYLIRILVILALATELSRHYWDVQNTEPDKYPNRPITLIVPFGPGGESDTFARMIQKALLTMDFLGRRLLLRM